MRQRQLRKSTEFQGHNVRYDQVGVGPPVVAIHGTPWSSFNLRHLIHGLADSHSVYYFDLLGYGQSSKADGDVSLGIQNESGSLPGVLAAGRTGRPRYPPNTSALPPSSTISWSMSATSPGFGART